MDGREAAVSWGTKTIQGQVYDLRHLDPFAMVVAPKDGSAALNVRVSFGLHTFAREWLPTDPLDHRMQRDSDVRCFCPARYSLSLQLPGIVRAAASGNAHFSRGANYLLVRDVGGTPYAVFFSMQKARASRLDVVMYVDSAYLKPLLPKKLPTIGFGVLTQKVANGQPISRPKK